MFWAITNTSSPTRMGTTSKNYWRVLPENAFNWYKIAFKNIQNILTSKLNEFCPEKTVNQRSEKTSSHVKNAATKANAFKQLWVKKEKSSKSKYYYENQKKTQQKHL